MSEQCEAYPSDMPRSKKRVPHNFEYSLIYHLIECFDVPNVSVLFEEILESAKRVHRTKNHRGTVYFGGATSFRRILHHYIYQILYYRRNMSMADIALKYGVSSRDVARGIKCPGSSI